jgi:hypothetical protein
MAGTIGLILFPPAAMTFLFVRDVAGTVTAIIQGYAFAYTRFDAFLYLFGALRVTDLQTFFLIESGVTLFLGATGFASYWFKLRKTQKEGKAVKYI